MAFLGIDYFDDQGKYIFLVRRDLYGSFANFNPSLIDQAEIIILSATEEFSRTDTTTVTEHPISTGSRHTDHYNVNPATVSFRGVISPKLLSAFSAFDSISSNGLTPDAFNNLKAPVTNYLTKVREIMINAVKKNESPLFTAYLPDGNSIENCVITSFGITRDSKVSDGYYVDITVQEVFFAETKYSVVPKNDTVTSSASRNTDTGQDAPETSIVDPKTNQTPLSAR